MVQQLRIALAHAARQPDLRPPLVGRGVQGAAPAPARRRAARLVLRLDDLDASIAERGDQALEVDARPAGTPQGERCVDEDADALSLDCTDLPHVVVIPAGPGEAQLGRVADLVDAIARHEPRAPAAILVVDDEPPRRFPAGVTVVPNPRNGRGIGTLGGTCAATFAGLAWAHANHPGAWVLRLDTDAAVIGPYAARVEERLGPGDGILGSCHVTCNGERRDVSAIAREVKRHRRPVWAFVHPPRRPGYVRRAEPRTRGILRAASGMGYAPGEHCIAAAVRGWLDAPERYIDQRLGDDMLLGAMCRAAGLQLRDATDIFGIAHRGLPDTPENLVRRGFAVIHSVK
jgi:hypothetical protein